MSEEQWQTENVKYSHPIKMHPRDFYSLLEITEKAKEWHAARSVRPVSIEMIERLANAEYALAQAVKRIIDPNRFIDL